MRAYEERLSAPTSWWVIAVFMAACVGAIFLYLGVVWSLVGMGIALAVLGGALMIYGRIRIRVTDDALTAGTARIPLSAVGAVTPLDAGQARRLRGVDADSRAFLVLRGYVPEAVRVDIADPDDPTPYLYLSSRRPELLARVLSTARGEMPTAGTALDTLRYQPHPRARPLREPDS